jgi:hypothetical protein
MMMANQQLSHAPPASWLFYTAAGADAASKSNLCFGSLSDPGCVQLYVLDFGANNSAVGHRRWLLYPQTTVMGTGDVPGSGPYQMANALWVIDNATYASPRPTTRDEFVAWPPPGYVPYQVVSPRWSFSYPGANFNSAIVTMQRNGALLPVRQEIVTNGFGENTIVWVPDNQDANNFSTPAAPPQDITTTVTVANVLVGGAPRNFTYSVTIFDPSTATPPSVNATNDFNLDGKTDILWQDPVTGQVQVWLLGGAQGTNVIGAANLTLANTWRLAGTGDFNSDGHADAVWQDEITGAAQVWFLTGPNGNVPAGAAVLSNGNLWRIRSVADFNSDGTPDIIWQDEASGWAQIWFMSGPQGSVIKGAVNLTTRNTWRIVGAADFNRDGTRDVVWQDPVTGAVQIWYMGGPQRNAITGAVNLVLSSKLRVAALMDLNADGHPDIIWQDPMTGASQVSFLGGTQGITTLGTAIMSGPNSWRIMGPK